MRRAIILAAGYGSRLVGASETPKPLVEVGGRSLLFRIVEQLRDSGIRETVIVIGHQGEKIRAALRGVSLGVDIALVEHSDYAKPNGTSLLRAASFVEGPTLLSMSDHLCSPGLISAVRHAPFAPEISVLGVDRNVHACFDLDDATKVRLSGDSIVNIGKSLTEYDALDTGIFRITPELVDALAELDGPRGVSLSAGVALLARSGRFKVADVSDEPWIDVDTPEAKRAAEALLVRYGDDLSSRQPGRPRPPAIIGA
jgi:1L-myo-inositol 1-phosphate cytidylyltransferase